MSVGARRRVRTPRLDVSSPVLTDQRVGRQAAGSPRQFQDALGPWQWPAFLGALAFASMVLPAGLVDGLGSRVPWIVVMSLPVLFDAALGSLGASRQLRSLFSGTLVVFAAVAAMIVALLLNAPTPPGVLAAVSFALATLAGWVTGRRWRNVAATLSWFDVGALIFLGISVLHLVVLGLGVGSLSRFHVLAVLPWGGSNYVAGVMVVMAFVLWSRRSLVPGARWAALAAGAVSVLTLSRGAFIALGAGLLVLLWDAGRTMLTRFLVRVSAMVLVGVGVLGFSEVTQQRSVGGYDPGSNVDARLSLFHMAWEAFVSSPFTGTGWLSLREPSKEILGADISYAHNFFLSFLQIGGLLGLAFIAVFCHFALRCWRTCVTLRPALIAGFAISMSDPFVESAVAGFVMWTILAYGTGTTTEVSAAEVNAFGTRRSRARRAGSVTRRGPRRLAR